MNPLDAEGRTPLHVAAEIGNTETARALLAAGANADARDAQNRTPREIMEARCTPLHRAARDGTAEDVARLLAAGEQLDAVDGFGQTALHRAARHGNEAVAEALLAAGADPRAKNLQQRRPVELLMVDRKALGLSDETASAIAHRLIFANAELRGREGRALPDAQPSPAAEARAAGVPLVATRPLSR
jgi:ankyrin repeat protein